MPLKTTYHAFQYETQKEYANEMMKCVLDGTMENIVFQGNKKEYLKIFHKLCDDSRNDDVLKKEVKLNYKDWIIVKSMDKWSCRGKNKK